MEMIYTTASVSLDGYVSGPAEGGFEYLFDWLGNGDVTVPAADREFRMTAASADVWTRMLGNTGACVVGRRLYDLTDGWSGNPPVGKPHVVLTHRGPVERETAVPFRFVSGIEDAIAEAERMAGGRWVSVSGGSVASQALRAGLLDEIWVSLTPVLLGGGTPFLSEVATTLAGPVEVVRGKGVTHLRYAVRTTR
ncbi:MAG: deaminase [Nonomuraea sp.]|nr:deaminase [Nonomuraea sp.]